METEGAVPESILIASEQLGNGMVIRFLDKSRRVAGDRWQVSVCCEAVIPLDEQLWHKAPAGDEPARKEAIRAVLGNELRLPLKRERNFVDEAVKEDLVREMAAQTRENMLDYLNDPAFPERLLARRYQEARDEVLRAESRGAVVMPVDDDEPADFSHLFTDSD